MMRTSNITCSALCLSVLNEPIIRLHHHVCKTDLASRESPCEVVELALWLIGHSRRLPCTIAEVSIPPYYHHFTTCMQKDMDAKHGAVYLLSLSFSPQFDLCSVEVSIQLLSHPL